MRQTLNHVRDILMDSGKTQRIVLRMSGAAKLIYIPTILLSLLFTIVIVDTLLELEALNRLSGKDLGILSKLD